MRHHPNAEKPDTLAGVWSGILDGPRSFLASWKLLNPQSWKLFVSYWLTALLVVLFFTLLVFSFGPSIKQAVVAYVFPQHWWWAGQMIFDNLFGSLGSLVLANFILHGGMAAISVSCFAIKELLSRRIEHDNTLLPIGHAPWPLWRQALEELKFAFLYLIAYDIIFWLGYPPWEINRTLARILSYLVLFVFFNITFMCPLFLRHRVGYGRMVRTFFARPLSSFGYSVFFLAPHLILSRIMQGASIGLVTGILLGVHIFTVAPAATAGTWMAARLLPAAKSLRPSPRVIKAAMLSSLVIFLVVSGLVFLHLADSIDKKSQILKCDYTVVFDSFTFRPPSWTNWSTGVSFEIKINNPTAVDIHIENSQLEIRNAGKTFSEVHLASIMVPAGHTKHQLVELSLRIDPTRLLDFKELIGTDWNFILWVDVEKGFRFPVYFR